jgi:V8-like Glu-specific endopeptidase
MQVMTVAHCVYEPWRKIWWQGLEFHPGRNLAAKDVGSSPLGSAPKADVRLHPNWTSTSAASASDAAIIITSQPIGRNVGWFRHKPPQHIADQQPQQQGESLKEAKGLGNAVSSQQLTLHIAGYPDNQANGSMWQQCCSVLDWQFQENLLWHDCYARCVGAAGGWGGCSALHLPGAQA